MARVLALDVGTSSVRAQVFDGDAADGPLAQRTYAVEQAPDALVAEVRSAVDEAGGTSAVDAVGASCFGHSLLAVDRDGKPLTPVLGWRDTRSTDAAEWLARRLDADEVHARTGCHIHTSYWPAKLAWLASADPGVFRGAARFVSFGDYLYARLLGLDDVPTSLSLASGTGLLDLRSRAWDDELLATLGVDADRLPRISEDALGTWFPAWLDGACSNVGAGCITRRRAALMVGTSGALRTLYETETPMPRPGLFLYRVDGRRVLDGGALSDGGNLYRWLEETLSGGDGSLADRDPDSHGLTFVSLLGGERSTGWHPEARGAVAGLTFATTALDIRQAALEGVAFRFAEVADLMPEVEEIVATGAALLADDDWCQIMADALGRPIVRSAVAEASLRGAAVLARSRLGDDTEDAPVGPTFEPRAERADAYRAARERQRELYRVATGAETS